MLYLTHIDNYYADKNKLQEAIKDFDKTLDRHLIDDIPAFIKKCQKGVLDLNAKHKRCGPEKVSFSEPGKPMWSSVSIYHMDGYVMVGHVKINLRQVLLDTRPEYVEPTKSGGLVKTKGGKKSVDPAQLNLFYD